MSTSPEAHTEDRLIRLISRWLGRHVGNADLLRGLEESGSNGRGPGQRQALDELAEAPARVDPGERGELEMIARETLEALALGDRP